MPQRDGSAPEGREHPRGTGTRQEQDTPSSSCLFWVLVVCRLDYYYPSPEGPVDDTNLVSRLLHHPSLIPSPGRPRGSTPHGLAVHPDTSTHVLPTRRSDSTVGVQ